MPPKKAAGTAKSTNTSAAKTTTKKAAAKASTSSTKAASKAGKPTTKKVTKKSTTKTSAATSSEPKAAVKAPAKKPAAKEAAARAPAKKPAAKKAAPVEDSIEPTTTTSKKRKSPDTTEDDALVEKRAKTAKASAPKPKAPLKQKASPKPKAALKLKAVKAKAVINDAPTDRLNVYVCGEGSSGELGLGNAKNAIDVKRPRLNAKLSADTIGVVQIAVGGMHVAALTHDNQIITWGVNDQGALGRDTTWDGGLMDVDEAEKDGSEASEDSEDDSGLNPLESTPTAVDDRSFPPGTTFVQVAAGDSTTFALTDDGFVYGWGTFRSNEGILGFSEEYGIVKTPILIPSLKKIKQITCGENHVLARDHKGAVFSWGSGQQNQLGRRIIERTRKNGLKPREFGLPKGITHVGAGAYHSFAIGKDGKVYSWGLNNFGETGVEEDTKQQANNEHAETVIWKPKVIKSLIGKEVTCIHGGAHHSIAVTKTGDCLVWGRIDGYQMGMKIDALPEEHVIRDDKGKARILTTPTKVPGIEAAYATAGSDHCVAITANGKAYSWGFSANYQTGQGSDDDVEVAKMIDNTAVRDQELNWAGAGGQFSIVTSIASK